jgi:Ca-activated chloride channel family protein
MKRAAAFALAALLCAAAAHAQEGQEPEVRLTGELVLVPVAVRHDKGGPVTDLRASELVLAEEGAPQEIALFEPDTKPADVVLLVDASASAGVSIETIRRAAYDFAKQTRPDDRISVVAFAARPAVLLDWSADAKAVSGALRSLDPRGGTALYDAAVAVMEERFRDRPAERRRALIVLSDGVDTLSSGTSLAASRAALRHDVSVYAVSTARILDEALEAIVSNARISPEERAERRSLRRQVERAAGPLERLTSATGGRVVSPRAPGDLSDAYEEIAAEIRSRYLLGYYPAGEAPGGFRAISVECKRPRVTIRAREGYFRE